MTLLATVTGAAYPARGEERLPAQPSSRPAELADLPGLPPIPELPKNFDAVASALRRRHVSAHFVQQLKELAGEPDIDRWVKPNAFGFRIHPDYSGHISPTAVRRGREFIEENRAIFLYAEGKYGVPKEVITALLWVETKLGSHVGTAPIATVYMNLALADDLRVRKYLEGVLQEQSAADPEYPKYRKKLAESSKRKAKWAIDQLVALEKMSKRSKMDVLSLKGSYAGAFGLAQFIPESYLRWARSRSGGTRADLFRPADAIVSVGHYLKTHGWKRKRKSSWRKALYGYNRSDDYGRTILELSDLLRR